MDCIPHIASSPGTHLPAQLLSTPDQLLSLEEMKNGPYLRCRLCVPAAEASAQTSSLAGACMLATAIMRSDDQHGTSTENSSVSGSYEVHTSQSS